METEDKIEARDLLDRVSSKLNYLTTGDQGDDGLDLILIDIHEEVGRVQELLK